MLVFALVLYRTSAADIFLLLDGIAGESLSARHAGWIEVQSFSEGVQRPNPNERPQFGPLSIVKRIDRSSPRLALHAIEGKRLSMGTLEVLRSGETAIRFLQVKMTNVAVTSFQQSAATAQVPMDQLSLDFRTIQWTYTEIDATGRPVRDITCSWSRDTGIGVGGTPDEDTDGDGLPDSFEELYGFDPARNDAAGDADSDGMSNIDEFRAGTIPTARDSVFRMTGKRTTENQVLLSWRPVEGKNYRLYVARDPAGPFEFVRVLDATVSAAGELSLKTTSGYEFFILQVE